LDLEEEPKSDQDLEEEDEVTIATFTIAISHSEVDERTGDEC
jgi:hypothetical protein